MGRPKGSGNKKAEVKKESKPVVEKPVVNVPRETILKPEVPSAQKEEIKKAKPVLEPLGAGQAYFESPEGEIIIGEANKDQIWSRKMNGGKGGWCNKRR